MAAVATRLTKFGAGLVSAARPRLSTAWKYARVEMKPPGPSEWGPAANELSQVVKSVTTGRFLQQTTKEATVNAVLVADVVFCFFIGECLGRGSLVGYKIPGAHLFAQEKESC